MKKINCLWIVFISCITVNAQIYINKPEGVAIQFFSKTPIEDISAKNTKAVSVIDFTTDSIVVKVPMNKFIFPNGLMQQHYNENYLETDKYPYALLKGKLAQHINVQVPGTYTTSISGIFTVHNVAKSRTFPCTVTVKQNGEVTIHGNFDVKLADHQIEIPSIVTKKIAEVVQVTVDANYIKKQ